jgi:prepilin-type processing-associated H-X9-DG protein
MRISLRFCFCFLLLCSTVHAQALVSRVPADAIAYVGWAGADSPTNGYSGSHLEAIVNSSNLSGLGEEFLPQLLAKMTAKNGDNGDGARFLQTMLGCLWRHPSAMYFSGMTIAPDGTPIPKFGILCQAGEDIETIDTFLNAATQNAPPKQMLRVIQSGDVIALTGGYGEDETPLANDPQQIGEVANRVKAIETDPDFLRVQKQVAANPLLFGYIDTNKLLAVVDDAVAAGDNDQAKDAWPKVRDASGLLGLKHIAFGAEFDGRDWATQAFVDVPSPRVGLLTVIEPKAIDKELLGRIPSTVGFAQIAQLDLGGLVNQARTMFAAARPDGAMMFDKVTAFVQLFIGRNPRTDIIDPLGSQWACYNDSSLGDNPMLDTIIVNKLADPDKARTGWEMLWFAAENVGGAIIRKKHLPITISQTTAGDLTIHTVETPIAQPSWTMNKGYLYFGLTPQAVITAANGNKPGFAGNAAFGSLAKKLAGDVTPTGFGFSDLPATAAAAYPQVQAALAKGSELLAVQDLQLPDNLLPPLEKLLPQLAPAAAVSWADDAGLHFKAVGPFPGAVLLSPRPLVGASGLNAAVLSSRVLGPALARAKNAANSAKSAENMRQIGRAILLYAAKNGGKCPPDLAALVSGGMLTSDCATDPAGEAYVYSGARVDISTVADASKTLVLREPYDAAVNGRVQVLFVDGHVEFVQEQDGIGRD